ncbi:MAG: prenyltransferase [Coriobacteriia bacterium]|nr:prenyltransferase [Coriobacteriia bacterium]MCL2746593.1 prenyltransferase [Coriobacteriia bacterium]MCL2870240.1 prenyltransferase [Coriobacteriia bacterium]
MKALFAGQGFGFWYKAARPISFGQSVMPYVLGALLGLSTLIYAGANTGIDFGISGLGILSGVTSAGILGIAAGILTGIIGLAGVIFAHAGMNLLDDYFDMKKGAVERREELLDGGFRARLGKCSYLKSGEVTLDDTKRAALTFLGLALSLGAVTFALRGWEVLIFAGITLVLGVFYAGPPLRLSYRGFGELVIGFLFGPVLVTASSFLVSGQITPLALFSSVPIGLLVANIVHIHAVMDYGPDLAAQRKTLPILLGSERAGVVMNIIFVVLAQLTILVGIALGFLPIAALLVALTYPLSLVFIKLALDYVKNKDSKEAAFEPKKWMGNFGDWESFRKDGLDWFMSRWLTARNLVMQLTLVLAIAAFTPWYL